MLLCVTMGRLIIILELPAKQDRLRWQNPVNRRTFFETLAKRLNFNTNKREDWYSIRKRDILHSEGV